MNLARFGAENGRIFLLYKGNKFIRYGSNDDKRYWRCCMSLRYECKSRVVTKRINGTERIKSEIHDHDHKRLKTTKIN